MESIASDFANIGLSGKTGETRKGPFWESVEQPSKTDVFATNPPEKPVKYYFFKLKDDSYADEFPGARLYPILIAPEIRKPFRAKRAKGDGGAIIGAADAGGGAKADRATLYLVPKKYFRQWVYASWVANKKEKKGKEVQGWSDAEKFPFIPTTEVASGPIGKHKPFTGTRSPVNLVNTRDAENNEVPPERLHMQLSTLYRLLAEAQKSVQENNGSIDDPTSKKTLNLEWNKDKGWFYRFPNAEAEAKAADAIPKNGLYVKLHSDQVHKLHTPGGAAKSNLQDMYIPKGWFQYFTGKIIKTDHETGLEIKTDVGDLGTIYRDTETKFWIRDQRGRPVLFKIENRAGVSQDSWTARYKTAVKWVETLGGWNRYLNPVLKIYLVAVDPRKHTWLEKCVRETQWRRQTQQTPVVVRREEVNHTRHHLLGTSPLNDYETWIEKGKWDDYVKNFPGREMPRSKEDITKILALVHPEQRADVRAAANLVSRPKNPNYHTKDYTVNALSARKIRDAKGKRGEVLSQNDVMGISAADVADILNWTGLGTTVARAGDWPGTGVWPAEWLHRSAFSWGGLAEAGQYETSQIRENLVFGSSECNSLMTRYEKCWQDLVKRAGSSQPNSKYFLATNTRNQAYTIIDENGQEIVPKYEEWNIPRWICYSLDYQLRRPKLSSGEAEPMVFETTFYPFQRGFFTSFEQELDSVILDSYFPRDEEVEDGTPEKLQWDVELPPGPTRLPGLLGKRAGDPNLGEEQWFITFNEQEDGFPAVEDPSPAFLPGMPNLGYQSHNLANQDSFGMSNPLFQELQEQARQNRGISSTSNGLHFSNFYQQSLGLSDLSISNTTTTSMQALELEDQSAGKLEEEFSYMSTSLVEVPEIQMNTVVMERIEEIPPTTETKAQEIHQTVWEELHAPGPTAVDGIILGNSQLVIAMEDTLPVERVAHNYALANQFISALSLSAQPAPPMNESISQDDIPPANNGQPTTLKNPTPTSSLASAESVGSSHGDSASSVFWSQSEEKSDIVSVTTTDEDSAMAAGNVDEKSLQPSSKVVSDDVNPLDPAQVEKSEEQQQPQAGAAPDEFVLKGSFELFGVLQTELYSLQSPNVEGVHHRISLPGELSLGKVVPSLADSDMSAIKLFNTTITYRSHATEAAPSGLSLSTSVYLSGFLQPVNRILRDVLGQDKPHINVTGLLGTGDADDLTTIPTPKGFTLRGEIPGVQVNLFGIMDITHLGLDIMGTRISSEGGYKYAYGFFGSGKIADASVDWYIMKLGKSYQITIVTQSDTWTNVGGITGMNLSDVLFEASWTGTDVSSVALKIQASLALRTGSLLLRGEYSQEQGSGERSQGILEVSGLLQNCTLETLCDIYEDIFNTKVTTNTNHEILVSALEFIVSTRDGLHLRGAVTVDGHTSANASIALSSKGIHITGDVEDLNIEYLPDIEHASLDININKEAVCVQLAATVVVEQKHKFDVSLYLNKNSGEQLEYTVYGAYQGDFQLRNLLGALEGTFLDVSLQEVAICASNMEKPEAQISQKLLAYDIKKGIQVYAKVASIKAISDLLRLSEPPPLTVCAFYQPGGTGGDSRFGINMILPTENVISFDRMKSGKLIITVMTTDEGPRLSIGTELFFEVDQRPQPLKLELELSADVFSARGDARCEDMWDNPLGLCKTLSVGNIRAGLGIDYAKFFLSGTPEDVTIGGDFRLDDFTGSVLIHTGTNPKEQLLRLEITNLDLAALVSFVAKIADLDLPPPPSGKDTFFIKHLLAYVSTGMWLKDRFFDRGIELDLDLIVFGKAARMHALVSDSKVAFAGSVESFNIGDLSVTGARGKGNPYIDLEVSKDARKFHISGRVSIKGNYVTLELHVDTGKDELYFDFELVIVDVLVVQVKASLEGSIPPAVKQIEAAAAAPEAEKQVELPKDVLADKQFNLDAYVEQNIVDYIIGVANDHLEKEGNPDHKNVLKQELDAAESSFSVADAAWKTKADSLNGIVASKQGEWDEKVNKATADRETSQKQLDDLIAAAAQEQRDLAVEIGLEKQRIGEQERAKTVALQEAVVMAQVAALECKRQLAVLQDFKTSFELASEARDAAEVELAACEAKCETQAGNEPALTDVAHIAWQWTYQELLIQRSDKIAKALTARAQLDVSKAMFDSEAYRDTSDQLVILEKAAQLADATFKKQETTAPANVKTAHEDCDQKVRMLKARQDGELRYLREKLARLSKVEAATKEDAEASMKEVKETNNPEGSPEYEALQTTRMARDKASVAYRSFSDLVHIANIFGEVLTRPLRFCIKALGGSFFSIKSMRIKGAWGGKSSAITAQLKGNIGFHSFDFDISWDMTDIADFLRGLWMRVGQVINDVGKLIAQLWDQGVEAFKAAAEGLKNGIAKGALVIQDAFNAVGKEIDEFLDDVREVAKDIEQTFLAVADEIEKEIGAIADAVEQAGEAVVETLEKGAKAVVEAVEDVAEEIGDALSDAGSAIEDAAEEVGNAISDAVSDAGDALNEVGRGIETVVNDVGEAVGDVVNDVGEVLEDVGEGIETAANDVGHAVGDVVNDVGEVLEDVGEGIETVVNDVGDAVGDVVNDVGEVLDDVGEGIETVVNDVGDAVGDVVNDAGEVLEDVGEGIETAANDVGHAVGDVVNDVGEVLEDVGEGIETAVNDVGHAVDDAVNDVGEVLEDVGEGIETAVNDVGGAVESVVEDIDDALSDAGSAVVSVVNDVGDAFKDLGDTVFGWLG